MQIIDNLLIMFIHVACFVTGIKLANWYNNRAHQQEKDALERQFLRLRANSDADDPCKPYMPRYDCIRSYTPAPPVQPTGEMDGDNLISPDFIERLKENGKATQRLKKQ